MLSEVGLNELCGIDVIAEGGLRKRLAYTRSLLFDELIRFFDEISCGSLFFEKLYLEKFSRDIALLPKQRLIQTLRLGLMLLHEAIELLTLLALTFGSPLPAIPIFWSYILAKAVLHLFAIYGDTPHNRASAVLLLLGAVDVEK